MIDKLDLFNELVLVVRPSFTDYVPQKNIDVKFSDTGLDSLDALMVSIYLSDMYGVPEEIAKQFSFCTIKELFDLMEQNATKVPKSVFDEIARIK